MLAPTPCNSPGCPDHATNRGACDKHQRVWVGSTRKARLPRDWNTRRLIVLKRDNHRCYVCQEQATEVDHIEPGDNHALTNLSAICTSCHRDKTLKESHEARDGNRIKRRY